MDKPYKLMKIYDCAFYFSYRAGYGNFASGFNICGEVVNDYFVLHISESYIRERYITFHTVQFFRGFILCKFLSVKKLEYSVCRSCCRLKL